MIAIIKKILDFCNVLSYDGKLSITNIAVIAMITKLVLSPSPDLATVGVTAVSFLNYMHKRNSNNDDKSGPTS